MTKDKSKLYLDYIPFIILSISAVMLIWTFKTTNAVLSWRNIAGLVILPLNTLFFIRQHQLGVLFLGFTLLLGLFGILSYTAGIVRSTMAFGFNNLKFEFWLQPIFLLWISIHFVLSGRYYTGILSGKYWQKIRRGKK